MREWLTRRRLLTAGCALGAVSLAGCSAFDEDQPATPDTSGSVASPAGWPGFARDAANTGHADAGPTDYGSVAWRTPVTTAPSRPGDRFPAPLVVGDTALVTVPNGPLRAISLADGTVAWERDARSPTTPAVTDGLVVRRLELENTGPVRAFALDSGEVVWSSDLPDVTALGGVTVAYDTVFATGGPRSVYALALDDGRVRWSAEPGTSHGAPAVADGRVFVATDAGVTAYDAATGERRWRRRPGALDTPSVADGRVFVGTEDGVVAFGVDGTPAWERPLDAPVPGTPAVVDGTVVAATTGGSVAALAAADGAERWRVGVDAPVTAPVAVADGVVYVPTHREEVAALSLADGSERFRTWVRGDVGATPAVAAGRVVVVDADGRATLLRNKEGGLSFPDVGRWTHPNADSRNTNWARDAILPADRSVRWRARFPFESGNGVVTEGRVFAADDTGVYALSAASGELDWRETFPEVDTAAVRAAGPDAVYVGVGGELVAFDPTPEGSVGERRWTTNSPTGNVVTAATPADGTVYTTTFEAGALAAVDAATGEVTWEWTKGTGFSNPPAVGPDHVFTGGTAGSVFAVDRETGDLVSETSFEGQGGAIALRDGVAFVARREGEILALTTPDGEELWGADLGPVADRESIEAPLAVTDDRVYAVGVDGGVGAYDVTTGEQRAVTELTAGTAAAPHVVDDTLLVGTWSDNTGARLYGLDPMDLSERWSKQVLEPRGFGTVADVVPADGSVFVLGPELARVG